MSKICFGTVIYKQASAFYTELMESVDNQTSKDFDVLIINDNYEPEDFEKLKKPERAVAIDRFASKLTPGLLRIELLLEAKKRGYDLLIIGDADDTFAESRVQQYQEAYELDKQATFYYNNLVTDKGLSVFDMLPSTVLDVRPISQANFLGMSTTAINMSKLSVEYIESLKKGDCMIFDWYLYSRLLLDVGYGRYVPHAETIYRIHDANEVGVTHDVAREKQVKLEHYNRLAEDYPYFAKLRDDLEMLDLAKINTEESYQGYWWSNIRMEDSYEI